MTRIIIFIVFGGFGFVLLYVGVTQHLRQRRLLTNAERVWKRHGDHVAPECTATVHASGIG
jgi:hypothetical protein